MARCELSGGKKRYELGEEPLRTKVPNPPWYYHHFKDMPDTNDLPTSEGKIEISFTIIYESSQTQKVSLIYDDTEENREHVRSGLEGMQDHSVEHSIGNGRRIKSTNKIVLPAAKSYEKSHRDFS